MEINDRSFRQAVEERGISRFLLLEEELRDREQHKSNPFLLET